MITVKHINKSCIYSTFDHYLDRVHFWGHTCMYVHVHNSVATHEKYVPIVIVICQSHAVYMLDVFWEAGELHVYLFTCIVFDCRKSALWTTVVVLWFIWSKMLPQNHPHYIFRVTWQYWWGIINAKSVFFRVRTNAFNEYSSYTYSIFLFKFLLPACFWCLRTSIYLNSH